MLMAGSSSPLIRVRLPRWFHIRIPTSILCILHSRLILIKCITTGINTLSE
jgi:hypothetical protein